MKKVNAKLSYFHVKPILESIKSELATVMEGFVMEPLGRKTVNRFKTQVSDEVMDSYVQSNAIHAYKLKRVGTSEKDKSLFGQLHVRPTSRSPWIVLDFHVSPA